MRRDDIKDDLSALAFEFFFWFSKFESALKEARYLAPDEVGAPARANWDKFVKKHRSSFRAGPAALTLLREKPQRQIVARDDLDFEEITFPPNTAELDRVVTYAKTVRNNLFHGGKQGSVYWDSPDQMRTLLSATIGVLDDLARLGGLQEHYSGYY